MRKLTIAMLVLALSGAVTAAPDKNRTALEGTWLPATAELAGKPFPDEVRKSIKLVIKGDRYTVTIGEQVDRGTLKLDANARPRSLDITGTEGPNKGRTIPAIYEESGDTLRICYDLSGKMRPVAFKSEAGTQLFLVCYRRENP